MHHATFAPGQTRRYDWVNIIFMIVIHAVALAGIVRTFFVGLQWENVVLAVIMYYASGLSITGGYHRLFSHKSYKAALPLRAFYLFLGAAGVQNSAINWASDHRRHHANTDHDDDPYDAMKGLWWSHMGWVMYHDPLRDTTNVPDMWRDKLVVFQHKYYVWIAVLATGVMPAMIGMIWGDPLGGFLWGGAIRLVFQYHSTFAINSLAHKFGRRPYNPTTTARDNGIIALVTLGEGYHNFHHHFPADYRNGVRAWQFDPTKWIVRTLSWVRLTGDLRRVSQQAIDRAREQARNAAPEISKVEPQGS
jgi:stearoyl-CoA desaturase (delta-9 desaturase)